MARGATDDAEGCLERALAIAQAQKVRLLALKAAISVGRIWSRRGRGPDATALVQPVLAIFDDRFDFPDLRDARMLLGLAKSA